jgi:hypothetical protein
MVNIAGSSITKEIRTIESAREQEVRLQLEAEKQASELRDKEETARHQRFLEKVRVLTLLLCVILASIACIFMCFSSRFQQEEKKRAMEIVQNVVVGIIGYFAGKASNKQNS